MKLFSRPKRFNRAQLQTRVNRSRSTGAIHLEQVQTRYHPQDPPVLNRFNLQVDDGEIVCLLGPSGVGKTTALRVIAGFERVINGYVRLGGRLVGSPFLHVPPHKRALGLVFQSYALFPHLTVAQNVQFGIKDVSDGEKRRRTGEILEMCGIDEYIDRGVHELSGGEQQRVALARAIAPESVAVLLDEPFSNLDPSLLSELRRQVKAIIHEAGKTAILVTHDRETAFLTADRVAVMRAGSIAQIGTAEEVYARPISPHVARAIGSSSFIDGTYRAGRVFTEAGEFPAISVNGYKLQDGEEVSALMRASELRLRSHESVPQDDDGWTLEPFTPCNIDCRCVARISSREFHGEFTDFSVRLPSGGTFRVRNRTYTTSIPDGAPVTVTAVRGAKVIVYPKDV